MKKMRAKAVPLNDKHPYDQEILEVVPDYVHVFKGLGNKTAAYACQVDMDNMQYLNFSDKERKRAARALYALGEVLNDKHDEYYLNRFADRILGYTADEEK